MFETALISLVSLLGLWILFFWLYSDYRNDVLKLQLFELRDRLFDLGADGRISFDHPAYGMLRGSMNGTLLHVERVGLLWVLAMQFAYTSKPGIREAAVASEARWARALESLPEDVRTEIQDIRGQLNGKIGTHLLLSSPIFWLVILPVVLWIVALLFGKAILASLGSRMAHAVGLDRLDFVGSDGGGGLPGSAA